LTPTTLLLSHGAPLVTDNQSIKQEGICRADQMRPNVVSDHLLSCVATKQMHVWVVALMLLVSMASILNACAPAQPVKTKVVSAVAPDVDPYVIGPDDVLEVIVWKEPDLSSHQLTVVNDGTITEPLAGRIQAAGKTTAEVQEALTKSLKPFVDNPNVTVRVLEARSQVIYIQGMVRSPGKFPLQSDEYLSQALAQAGGFSEFADRSKIRIERHDRDKIEEITIDYRDVQAGEDLTADIRLVKGDTIFVK
jgi:polysaccharide export outer membrane protein